MKIPLQNSSLSDISICSSTSNEPKNHRDVGYTTASSGENMATKKGFFNLPREIDATLVRKVLAEALGTFMLMFCIGGIMSNLNRMGIKTGLMEYAATAGLAVIIIAYSTGSISGAHVNPAVTIAFATIGPFPWSQVPLYILAQVGGSVVATYAGKLVYNIKPEMMMTRPLQESASAFWVELITTFIVLFVITALISESQNKQGSDLSGFVAGVAIGVGVLVTGPVSGGSMNPARSLGPALVSWRFDHLWIYLVAPTVGAIGGVFAYRILRLQGWSCESDISQTTLQVSHSSLH